MMVFEELGLEPLVARFKPILNKKSGIAIGLWGEAGIGKSWTANRLLQQLSCKHYRLHSTGSVRAFSRNLPKAKLPAWAEFSLERLQRGEHLEAKAIVDTLVTVLSGLAPVVLHVDDLHEASTERQALWCSLASAVHNSRGVGLLVTSRIQPPEELLAVRLRPLALEGLERLLEGELGTALPAEAIQWIYKRSMGNPLFALEYLRFLSRQGHLWNDGRQWRWRNPPGEVLPTTIEALLEHLIHEARLPPEAQSILGAKALLPMGVEPTLWSQVADVPVAVLQATQQLLQQRGLLHQTEFAHPLIREVVLQNLPKAERKRLAGRAIGCLQPHDPIAAAGFLPDAQPESSQALSLLLQAVQQAEAQGDVLGAAHWKAQASEYAEGEAKGSLALEAAQVLQQYDLTKALALGQKALLYPTLADQALPLVGLLLARQGDVPELERLLSRSPQINPDALRLQAHQLAAQHPKVIELWEGSLEMRSSTDAKVLYAVAISYLALGKAEAAHALLEQALALPLNPNERRDFWGIGAILALNQGRYTEAAQLFEQTIAGLREAGDRRKLGAMLHNLSIAHKELLGYPKAQNALQEALVLRQRMGDHKGYAHSLALMAELQVELGQQSQAEASVEEALSVLQLYGPSHFLINVLSQASYIFSQPQTPLAKLLQLKYASRALGYAEQTGNPRLEQEMLYDYSVAQTQSGNPQAGLKAAQKVLELAPSLGDPPQYRWRAQWAIAMALEALNQPEPAKEHLNQALDLVQAIADELNFHKLGLELARINQDITSAQTHLGWFERHALLSGVSLALRYFPQLAQAPNQAPAQEKLPELCVLGPMQIGSEAVRGNKRKELLAALLEAKLAGHPEVSSLQLLDALYPSSDEGQAGASLRDLVHQLRSSVGSGAILTTANGYALGLSSDAERFLQQGQIQLWRGPYLEDLGLEVAGSTVREALYQSLTARLEALLETDPKEVARVGRILLEADAYDTHALRLTLVALRNSKNHKTLARLYQQAKAQLLEVGEVLPDSWQDFLVQPIPERFSG